MPTDAERWRFLADNNLTLGRSPGRCFVAHYAEPESPAQGRHGKITPIADGATADEAIDLAIERWEKKHKRPYVPGEVNDETHVRGSASGSAEASESVRGAARRSPRRP